MPIYEQPGLLFVIATLLPLASFVVLLLLGGGPLGIAPVRQGQRPASTASIQSSAAKCPASAPPLSPSPPSRLAFVCSADRLRHLPARSRRNARRSKNKLRTPRPRRSRARRTRSTMTTKARQEEEHDEPQGRQGEARRAKDAKDKKADARPSKAQAEGTAAKRRGR